MYLRQDGILQLVSGKMADQLQLVSLARWQVQQLVSLARWQIQQLVSPVRWNQPGQSVDSVPAVTE